jgi:hypothetical protein
MITRKALTPNNRRKVGLSSEFYKGELYDKSPTNRQSAFTWARAGRQNSEGFGGGRVVGNK